MFDKPQKQIFDALIDAGEAASLAQEVPLRAALGVASKARSVETVPGVDAPARALPDGERRQGSA